MLKNITTSSFKRLPAGLLTALALFILTEAVVYINRPNLLTDHWNKFLINEHRLVEMAKDFKYVIMGDSTQKTGIDPRFISDDMINLSLPGGKPLGLYLLLKRYYASHPAPETLFLYISPENPHDSMLVILRYFVSFTEYIMIWKDLSWHERRVFWERFWATLDFRKVNLTKRDEYLGNNKEFLKKILKNRGYMPSPRAEIELNEDFFIGTKHPVESSISITSRDMRYLNKIMGLASSHGTKVVFLGYLIPEELYNMHEQNGFNNEYRNFYASLQETYPEAAFSDRPILAFKNKFFGDPQHLNVYGTALYTLYFKEHIFERNLKDN